MAAVRRYDMNPILDAEGPFVRFVDVEDALADRDRLTWLLPVIAGTHDDKVGDLRTQALAAGLMLGKTGRDLVDFAREGCIV